jgi:hypothetical protein
MFLPSRHYESEQALFLRKLQQERPELAQDKRAGRAIWWDKRPQELAARKRMDEARLPMPAYVYQPD